MHKEIDYKQALGTFHKRYESLIMIIMAVIKSSTHVILIIVILSINNSV